MKRPLFYVCLTIVFIIAMYNMFFPPSLPDDSQVAGREIMLTGQVYQKEYRSSYGNDQLILYLSEISILYQEESYPIEKIICYMKEYEIEPKLFSTVCLEGVLEGFSVATNPGEFDAKLYYATLGIAISLKDAKVLAQGEGYSHIRERLWEIRNALVMKLESFLNEEDASILKTMLFGDKTTLDKAVKTLYQHNGIVHILAISGLHISILGLGVYKLLRKIGVFLIPAALCSIAFIFSYGLMTGAGISAYRAVGMFFIRMLGEILGRAYDLKTALGVLMVFMIMQQPLYLYHSGFLLSFGSILGIACISPVIIEGGRRKKHRFREGVALWLEKNLDKLRKGFLTSFSITLATLPIQLWYFYEIPIYGIFLNLIVIPLMGILMPLGIALSTLPLAFLSRWLGLLIHFILVFVKHLCQIAEAIPFCNWIGGRPDKWQVFVYVLLLAILIILGKEARAVVKVTIIFFAVIVLSLRFHPQLEVSFLDVGQGDGIVVRVKDAGAYLIDGGSTNKKKVGEYQILPFLKSQGIGQLEAIIITHPDLDHMSGIVEILENKYSVSVKRLILPYVAEDIRKDNFKEIEEIAREKEIEIYYMATGTIWQEGGVTFTCLHPPKEYRVADSNAYSQVLYLEIEDFSMLLTGDVEGEGERQLIGELNKQEITKLTILKVAHHGSKNSTSEVFLEQLRPQVGIISCGERNSYGHPHKEVVDRLGKVGTKLYQTKDSGAITISYHKGKVLVKVFRKGYY